MSNQQFTAKKSAPPEQKWARPTQEITHDHPEQHISAEPNPTIVNEW
jgi:hypothetical protein